MLNRKELERIDVDRVKDAAQRLSMVEPTRFRNEISDRLVELLDEEADAAAEARIAAAAAAHNAKKAAAMAAKGKVALDNATLLPINKMSQIQVVPLGMNGLSAPSLRFSLFLFIP